MKFTLLNNNYNTDYDEKFAIIIGINSYKSANDLEYAENDAIEVKKVLIEKYNYKEENIKMLLNENATKENILNVFNSYIDNVGKDDSILFYFAGHGETKMSIEGNAGFLIPYEGTEENWNTLISWEELTRISKLIMAKHIFFVLDACYSGLALTRTASFGRTRFLNDILTRNARQVLTAGKADQTVKDGGGPLQNHSLFTGYFLKALSGDAEVEKGVLTANQIMAYVYNKVGNNTYSRQTPSYGYIYGDGDFVFNFKRNLEEKDGKYKDTLVNVPSPVEDINQERLSDKSSILKELLSDYKNKINIYEFVNDELRTLLGRISLNNNTVGTVTEENFKEKVNSYNKVIKNMMEIIILLVYYGQDDYINLVKKILERLEPKGGHSGSSIYIRLLNYPCYILYYCALIAAWEANNINLLASLVIFNKKVEWNRVHTNLLERISNEMNGIASKFSCLMDKDNYKFPMNEYIYNFIQPVLDDILFLGDEYENIYTNIELLISILTAVNGYSPRESFVFGPTGRYNYKLEYYQGGIEQTEGFKMAESIGVINKLGDNKKDFIEKYNVFMSQRFF